MCRIFVSLFFLVSFIFPFFFSPPSFLTFCLFPSFYVFIQYYVCGVLSGPNVWDTHTLTLPPAVWLAWEELEENTWKCHHHFCPEAAGAGLTNANSRLKYLLPPSSRLALKWMPLSSLCTDSAVCLQLSEPFMNTLCLYLFFTLRTLRTELLMGSAQQQQYHSSVSTNISPRPETWHGSSKRNIFLIPVLCHSKHTDAPKY